MALKFLNKEGWHTRSLQNIENVQKAEQKHDAEQRKLEELKKQIQDERQKAEYRLIQEQAGFVPARRGRIYLPQDELVQSGLSEEDIFAGKVTGKWRHFMKKQIIRARKFFDEAENGIAELSSASR